MPVSVPVEEVVCYTICSEMYRLSYVEEVPPSVTVGDCFGGALRDMVKMVLSEDIGVQEAGARFVMRFSELLLGSDMTTRARLGFYEDLGRKWLAAFITLELPGITGQELDVPVEGDLPRYSGVQPMTLTATIPIREPNILTWVRPYGKSYRYKSARNDLEMILGAVITGYADVSSITYKNGTTYRWRVGIDEGRRSWSARLAYSAREGIQIKSFRPCHPDNWRCHARVCRWWKKCRGKAERTVSE